MMTVLLVFKLLSLFFEGVTWFNVQSHGSPVGWNVLYYIFAFLKGIFLFVVVLLVGTGWSLLKVRWPYRVPLPRGGCLVPPAHVYTCVLHSPS